MSVLRTLAILSFAAALAACGQSGAKGADADASKTGAETTTTTTDAGAKPEGDAATTAAADKPADTTTTTTTTTPAEPKP